MGAPAVGLTSLYRNPLEDVVLFFERRHPTRYKIYNCCPELPYPTAPFTSGQFASFDVQDHTPPTMEQFVAFLNDAAQWRSEDAARRIAVHCKGGKGRTGSLCCAWLLYSRACETTQQARPPLPPTRCLLPILGVAAAACPRSVFSTPGQCPWVSGGTGARDVCGGAHRARLRRTRAGRRHAVAEALHRAAQRDARAAGIT